MEDKPTQPVIKTSKVMILYTGGTIGMKQTGRGLAPAKNYLTKTLSKRQQFHDPLQAPLTTKPSKLGKRVHYIIKEFENLMDSSNMVMQDWQEIAKQVELAYNSYDAFIILHGTDTMAYTASALSFMFQNLTKPVILTGSQVPISADFNDAVDNLYGALMIAGHFIIPEVCIYFNHKLYRGNRTTKYSSEDFGAFKSYNYPPLVDVGINFHANWKNILKLPCRTKSFKVYTEMSQNIAVLKLYPGMTPTVLKNLLSPPLEGCVLQTYGSGSISNSLKVREVLQEAVSRGVVILNVTQCLKGKVTTEDEASFIEETGIIPGRDLTTEAALAKLGHLIGRKLPREDIIQKLRKSMRGEQGKQSEFTHNDTRILDAFITALSSGEQTITQDNEIIQTLLPLLLCAVTLSGNTEKILQLIKDGASLNVGDYDGRTPLHIAAGEGKLEIVKLMYERGAYINPRDKFGATPLDDALRHGHKKVAQFLLDYGGKSGLAKLIQHEN